MMFGRYYWGLGAVMLSACAVNTGDEGATATAAAADTAGSCTSIGPGTPCSNSYLYLMCNSTGFNPTEATRLRSVGNSQYQLTYSVPAGWMVSGDSCRVVETNQQDGWGTQNKGYTLAIGSKLSVPATANLGADGGFQIVYPSQGTYTATVTWGSQPTINVTTGSASAVWEPVLSSTAHITSIATSPINNNFVWVAYDDGTVFRTSNGTAAKPTWAEVDSWTTSTGTLHLPGGTIRDIAVTPAFEDTAVVAFAGTLQGSKVWTSGEGGQSWTQVTTFPQDAVGEILSVSISPVDGRVYVNGVNGLVVGNISGSVWQAVSTPDPLKPSTATGNVSSVAQYEWSSAQSVLVVGTTAGEVFLSMNGASGWMRIDEQQPYSVTPARRVIDLAPLTTYLSKPGIFVTFEGMQPNASGVGDSVWYTPSGGQGWSNIYGNLPTTPAPTNVYSLGAISVNPVDPTVLYVSFTGDSAKSSNQGASWVLSAPW